jgi:nucleoside-diphosphate-sugar epimerase
MRVFVAGATGAIGRPLVKQLIAGGHQVTGMTRSPQKAEALGAAGAEPVVADALDAAAVELAVRAAEPDVVVHQLTAIPAVINPRSFARDFEQTNRLREQGTRHLVDAARDAGARRVVSQSIAFAYAPGAGPHDEADPLWLEGPAAFRRTVHAVAALEEAVLSGDALPGAVLRYGFLYGPGTGLARGGALLEAVRRRRFPVGGGGRGVWSFVHVDDAARATVLALESTATGALNVVDDEPAAIGEWVPELARVLGAPAPRRLPLWVIRLLAGSYGAQLMSAGEGASNRRARKALAWSPRFASWREGFRAGLG